MPIDMHPELPAGDNPKTKAPARVLGGGVPGSPNSDPILDQKMSFFTPVFRPGL